MTDGINWEEVHRLLQDVLESLKDVIKSHPSLNSADILHQTASIISSVKGSSSLCSYSVCTGLSVMKSFSHSVTFVTCCTCFLLCNSHCAFDMHTHLYAATQTAY